MRRTEDKKFNFGSIGGNTKRRNNRVDSSEIRIEFREVIRQFISTTCRKKNAGIIREGYCTETGAQRVVTSRKELMKTAKSTGPRTEPCGTSCVIGKMSEKRSAKEVKSILPDR